MKQKPTTKRPPYKTVADILGDKLAFDCRDCAKLFDVTPSTIRRWIASGGLPVMDLPGDKRISRAVIVRKLGIADPSAN
jgi:hypothetical protein